MNIKLAIGTFTLLAISPAWAASGQSGGSNSGPFSELVAGAIIDSNGKAVPVDMPTAAVCAQEIQRAKMNIYLKQGLKDMGVGGAGLVIGGVAGMAANQVRGKLAVSAAEKSATRVTSLWELGTQYTQNGVSTEGTRTAVQKVFEQYLHPTGDAESIARAVNWRAKGIIRPSLVNKMLPTDPHYSEIKQATAEIEENMKTLSEKLIERSSLAEKAAAQAVKGGADTELKTELIAAEKTIASYSSYLMTKVLARNDLLVDAAAKLRADAAEAALQTTLLGGKAALAGEALGGAASVVFLILTSPSSTSDQASLSAHFGNPDYFLDPRVDPKKMCDTLFDSSQVHHDHGSTRAIAELKSNLAFIFDASDKASKGPSASGDAVGGASASEDKTKHQGGAAPVPASDGSSQHGHTGN